MENPQKNIVREKQQEAGQKQNFKKGSFQNQQRTERKQDRFTLLTKTPKEILALDKGKFKPPSPMTTQVEKRNASKFCEFHGEVGHTTDECMHLKRQIEEMLGRKVVTFNKEIKAKQWERPDKDIKKGGNLRERQVVGNINGTTMAEDSKIENYSNFLSGVSNFFSTPRGRGWDGRSHDY
ncbi:hypothetical protein Tco_0745787 [Tanacetum coccineum]